MAVQDRVHVGPRLIDFGMDEALGIDRAVAMIDRPRVEIEFHDVVLGHASRRQRGRHQIALRIAGMARADVPEPVDHALAIEDAVGGDEIDDHGVEACFGTRTGYEHRDECKAGQQRPSKPEWGWHRHLLSDFSVPETSSRVRPPAWACHRAWSRASARPRRSSAGLRPGASRSRRRRPDLSWPHRTRGAAWSRSWAEVRAVRRTVAPWPRARS